MNCKRKSNAKEKHTVSKLTSTWSQRWCFSQISAILSRGSNAPSTVVPAVAQTRNGADPCNRIQNKKLSFTPFISLSIYGKLKYNKVMKSRTKMWQSTFYFPSTESLIKKVLNIKMLTLRKKKKKKAFPANTITGQTALVQTASDCFDRCHFYQDESTLDI